MKRQSKKWRRGWDSILTAQIPAKTTFSLAFAAIAEAGRVFKGL
jgi:hypothetical protein